MKNLKFCYDEYDDTIYALAFEAVQSSFFGGYQVSVGTGVLHICQVKRIEERNDSFSEFIEISVSENVSIVSFDIFFSLLMCIICLSCFGIIVIIFSFLYVFFIW